MLVIGDASVQEWVINHLKPGGEFFHPVATVGVIDEDKNLVAAVVYSQHFNQDVHLTIASVSPNWASRQAINGILSFPFNSLKCKRITALTERNNNHVRDFLIRLGFMHEGTLHDAGNSGDMAIYGMTKRYFLRSKWNG